MGYYKWIILLLFAIFATTNSYGQEYTLTLHVSNIKEKKGTIIVSVFDNINDFLKEGREFYKQVVQVKDSFILFTFRKIPKGRYAIALFHDLNGDSKCNKNLIGLPKEGFGFSNNYIPIYRPPKFDEVQFEIKENHKEEIKLLHF